MATFAACDIDECIRLGGPIRALFTSATTNAPALIREPGNIVYDSGDATYPYKMYFSGSADPYTGSNVSIYMAYASTLGGTWAVYGEVIAAATLPMEDPYVIFDGTTYHLFAENKTGGNNDTGIAYFTASNGITWTRQDSNGSPFMDSASTWDAQDVSSPAAFDDGGTESLLYEGRGTSQPGQMGLATMASWGASPTPDAGNPVYSRTASSWDAESAVVDDVTKVGSTYYVLQHAVEAASGRISSGSLSASALSGTWTQRARLCWLGNLMYLGDGEHVYGQDTSNTRIVLYQMQKLA